MVKFSSMVVVTKLPPHYPVALYNDPSQMPSFRHTQNFAHMANGCDSFFSSRPSSPDLSWKAVEVATEHSRS